MIANNIIRACPFCSTTSEICNKIGNIEHLHLYCSSRHLKETRFYCNQKIENATLKLYDYASRCEFGCSLQERPRNTVLQEIMTTAAREAELEIRPIVKHTQLVYEAKNRNQAILSRLDVQLAALLHRIPHEKIDEYDNFPEIHQLGFMHAIPEEAFNISEATITDVSFLGMFPKKVFQAMQQYERQYVRANNSNDREDFKELMDNLISTIIYRTITMQKVVHLVVAKEKEDLNVMFDDTTNNTSDTDPPTNEPIHRNMGEAAIIQPNLQPHESLHPANKPNEHAEERTMILRTNTMSQQTKTKKRRCYATKCRLLQARGIIRRTMRCTTNRNMYSGCIIEQAKQRRVKQLEVEMLALSCENHILTPLLEYRTKPYTLKKLRRALQCLPSITKEGRDDIKFGAVRYLAHTLGIAIIIKIITHRLLKL
jgi:hypothetical protein